MPKKPKNVKKDSISFLLNNEDSDSEADSNVLENELHELLGNDLDETLSDSADVNDPALIAELEAFASVDSEERSTTKPSPLDSAHSHSPDNNAVVTQSDIDSLVAQYYTATDTLKSKDQVDAVKLRRYERVIKELELLSSRLSAGRPVRLDELPPSPALGDLKTKEPEAKSAGIESAPSHSADPIPCAPPTPLAKPPPSKVANDSLLQLKTRGQEYKIAAVKARDAGQTARAKELLIAAKFIEDMLPKVASGEEPFDPESDMPPPPDEYVSAPEDNNHSTPAPTTSSLPPAMLSTAVTVENLKQRMAYFQTALDNAQSDPPKSRRMKRILTEYSTALNALQHQVASFDFSTLPSPPGCPSLAKSFPRTQTTVQQQNQARTVPSELSGATGGGRNEQVINLLNTRQAELKAAALKAKQSGDMALAKTHLRAALGMNPLIESALAGQPIDLAKVPRLGQQPNAQAIPTAFHGSIMTGKPCDIPSALHLELESAADEQEKQELLLNVLRKQSREAEELSSKLSESGYAQYASKVADLAKLCEASISFLLKSKSRQHAVHFGFEWANLPQLNFNHDLGDGVLEVCVVRGMAYPLPADISHPDKLDTQVELVLPYPTSDNPQKHCTDWVKHTCDPSYDSVARFQVDMKSRVFQFLLKSGRCLRATVYYSRGFLRSARVLGTVNFQLTDLAHSVTFTVFGDLMEGRKAIGGRLQLRVRQRSAASSSQITSCSKPWLVLTLPKPANEPVSSIRRGHPDPAPPPPQRHPLDPDRASAPHDLYKRRSPPSSKSPTGSYQRGVVNNHAPNVQAPTEGLHSLDLLYDDRRYFEKRLADPGLSNEDRHRYESRRKRVNQLIGCLKTRLEGKNSAAEIKAYVGELRALIDQTQRRYEKYSAENNTHSASQCKYELEIMKKELERYTRSNQH